mmetsp:Transcript_8329/g.14743  ORF Transcript_8329/g.14743 Transcript_8329/m.14743 type:complete len:229 (+) Transcript_8329:221-907(+)
MSLSRWGFAVSGLTRTFTAASTRQATLLPRNALATNGGSRSIFRKAGPSSNTGGVQKDMFELFGEDQERATVSMEEVHAQMRLEEKEERKRDIEFLKQWKETTTDPYQIGVEYDWDKYFESIAQDYMTVPENLKGIVAEFEHYEYLPKMGGYDDIEQRNTHCKLHVEIDQFNWSEEQFNFFVQIVAQRYKPSERKFTLTSRKFPTVAENVEECKRQLSALVTELKKVK